MQGCKFLLILPGESNSTALGHCLIEALYISHGMETFRNPFEIGCMGRISLIVFRSDLENL